MVKQGFVIHHNGPNVGFDESDPHSRCIAYWSGVKAYHMNTKGWSDIAYSFGECPHGTRFVGRGWDKNQFANGSDVVGVNDGKDSEWYTVLVFLGWNDNYTNPVDEEPSTEMVAGVTKLITEGRTSGRCGMRILPHNAFKIKRCPGAYFTNYAKVYTGRPFVIPTPVQTIREDDDMFIVKHNGEGPTYATRLFAPPIAVKLTSKEFDDYVEEDVKVLPTSHGTLTQMLDQIGLALD